MKDAPVSDPAKAERGGNSGVARDTHSRTIPEPRSPDVPTTRALLGTKEVAGRIRAHLERFEADPAINTDESGQGRRRYYEVNAWAAGRYINVRYIAYQLTHSLPRADAERYLAWLDAGNVGSHYAALRATTDTATGAAALADANQKR